VTRREAVAATGREQWDTAERAAAGRTPGGRGGGQTNWDATVIAVGRGVEGFDVSPDGREIWAANAQDGTISVIDASARTVSQTIQANVNGANRLKFTPDGTKVLVSSLGGPELAVFDVAKHQALKRIPIGKGAAGIEVQPDGARARRVYLTTTSSSST
jgi:YVTN family beta-propeller protein